MLPTHWTESVCVFTTELCRYRVRMQEQIEIEAVDTYLNIITQEKLF